MRYIPLLLMAACATSAGNAPTPTPSPTFPAPATTPAPPALDDAAAIARARAFLASVDGRDLDAFRGMISKGFALFEDGYTTPADQLSKHWATPSKRPPRTRECTDELIRRSDNALVYIGDCTEHDPPRDDRPAQDWQGWNTVVLVPEDGAWKVALWQWHKGGIEAERERWNDAYRRGISYIKKPNRLLVETVAGTKPGTALVVAMGQGRNALYLAEKGWKVTGIDISDEGIRLAREAAAERGLELDTVLADVNNYDFGTARWDLVTMIYAGSDQGWIERIKPSIKPGGRFVLEFFHKDPDDPNSGNFIGVRKGQLAASFVGWNLLRDEVVEDIADWGKTKAELVRFVAQKPR